MSKKSNGWKQRWLECQETRDTSILYVDYFFKKRQGHRRWSKTLGKSIVEFFKPTSVLDIGCGLGHFIEGAKEAGVENVFGYDIGYENAKPYLPEEIKDYVTFGDAGKKMECGVWDCVISVEVAEHLFEENADTFVDNIQRATENYAIITASPKGGYYHLNPQPVSYWIEKFGRNGMIYCPKITNELKRVWTELRARAYLLRNLLVFQKEC